MQSAAEKPLPLHFYNAKPWLKSLVVHYVETYQLLPAGVLMLPLATLTRAIENVINIYGNFPQSTYQFFRQTINPLFEPNEYYNTVYLKLKEIATRENKPNFFILADSLLALRRFFEKDRNYLEDYFNKELSLLSGSPEEQFQTLSEALHNITRIHVNQVAKMIKSFQQ